MLEVDEDSRLGREMLSGGARYHAELVPSDDAIAGMYETAADCLAAAGLAQYEISNFSRPGLASRHNIRYWQGRPYLGLGLDASSMLLDSESAYALRSKTTDDLKSYLQDTESPETAWLSPDRRHEEAWFLGLRMNSGVDTAALAAEFGNNRVAPALEAANRLTHDDLLVTDGDRIRLTPRGRLLSNDVFQEFLSLNMEETEAQRAMRESRN
jgi:oxygen-independent coproporphyrinogen-3 oxidase